MLLYFKKFIVFLIVTICKKTFWIRLQCILVKSSTILTRSSTVAFCFIPLPSDIIICSAISAIFSRDKSKNVSMRSPSTNPCNSTYYFILDFIMSQRGLVKTYNIILYQHIFTSIASVFLSLQKLLHWSCSIFPTDLIT